MLGCHLGYHKWGWPNYKQIHRARLASGHHCAFLQTLGFRSTNYSCISTHSLIYLIYGSVSCCASKMQKKERKEKKRHPTCKATCINRLFKERAEKKSKLMWTFVTLFPFRPLFPFFPFRPAWGGCWKTLNYINTEQIRAESKYGAKH